MSRGFLGVMFALYTLRRSDIDWKNLPAMIQHIVAANEELYLQGTIMHAQTACPVLLGEHCVFVSLPVTNRAEESSAA